ncbi:hypothetical protein M404DRAFT_1003510 [Pisolithus tinctorius Marx 270]|uniref:Uncharacterized protein n=1 Tax=Pisolithus tinctorius Marx 270 TaxID=870435 RepID=A0A0C3NZT0_PISTI|nr:hypothetical protein M404DRAFT_1003510 [Pisolithus tinctorius Marx 270]
MDHVLLMPVNSVHRRHALMHTPPEACSTRGRSAVSTSERSKTAQRVTQRFKERS